MAAFWPALFRYAEEVH